MRDISMHILDIVQNSVVAKATIIEVDVFEELKKDRLYIRVADNGKGMDETTLQRVVDPFYTSRTTRKVGLGVPMFKRTAEMCEGDFNIKSVVGQGTTIEVSLKYSHIDRPPLGDMAETVMVMVNTEDDVDFIYRHRVDDKEFKADTREMREVLGEVPLNSIDVLYWIKEHVKEGVAEIRG